MNGPIQPPASDQLHPLVQKAAAGLLIWFVIAAWLLFGGAGYIDLSLAVVSVLVFMAIAVPSAIWRAGVAARRRDTVPNSSEPNAYLLAGLWMIASPFVLGFAHTTPMHVAIGIGLAVTYLALLDLWLIHFGPRTSKD